MKKTLLIVAGLLTALTAFCFTVEWDKIVYWAGEGPNKAALVVQFLDDGPQTAYVWGYRWAEGIEPSGEDMFRAIAAASPDLLLFSQYTGWMGSTVCGIGYSPYQRVADGIVYDFSEAKDDPYVSFNYFSVNELMGQTEAPGWNTPDLCDSTIVASKVTHIIDHPINALVYGYPAYDYDHWQLAEPMEDTQWNAGWYTGYWSYWVGTAESDSFSYSGLGMTSRKLKDGDVDGWKFAQLDGPVTGGDYDGVSGASDPWYDLDYTHFGLSGVEDTLAPDSDAPAEFFRLDGTKARPDRLTPGIYIVRRGARVFKIRI